jgi:rubrerythrin
MTASISYFIAGISIFALLTLWFFNAYQVLSRKRKDVRQAENQVRLHREGCLQMRGSSDEQAAMRILEISSRIYMYIEKSYNETFSKSIYRFPGLLMGFRMVNGVMENEEENRMIYLCEDCGFVFYRAGEIKECPSCEKQRIRPAAEPEISRLRPFLEQQKLDLHAKGEKK